MSKKPKEFLEQYINFSSKIFGDEKRVYDRSSSTGVRTSANNSSLTNNEKNNPIKLKAKHYANLRDIFFNLILRFGNAIPNISSDKDLYDNFKKRIEILIDAFIKISLFTKENADLFYNIFGNKKKDKEINEEIRNFVKIKEDTLFLCENMDPIQKNPMQKNVLYKQYRSNYIYFLSKISDNAFPDDTQFIEKYEEILKAIKTKIAKNDRGLSRTQNKDLEDFISIFGELSNKQIKQKASAKPNPKVKFLWQIFERLAPLPYKSIILNTTIQYLAGPIKNISMDKSTMKSLFNFCCYLIGGLTKEEKEEVLKESRKADEKKDLRFYLFEALKNLITLSTQIQNMTEFFNHDNNCIYKFWKFCFTEDPNRTKEFFKDPLYRFLRYLNFMDNPFIFDCYRMKTKADFLQLTEICDFFIIKELPRETNIHPTYPNKNQESEEERKRKYRNLILLWTSYERLIFSPSDGDISIPHKFPYEKILYYIRLVKMEESLNPLTLLIEDKLLIEYYFDMLLCFAKERYLFGKTDGLSQDILSNIEIDKENDVKQLFDFLLDGKIKEVPEIDAHAKGLKVFSLAFFAFLKVCFFIEGNYFLFPYLFELMKFLLEKARNQLKKKIFLPEGGKGLYSEIMPLIGKIQDPELLYKEVIRIKNKNNTQYLSPKHFYSKFIVKDYLQSDERRQGFFNNLFHINNPNPEEETKKISKTEKLEKRFKNEFESLRTKEKNLAKDFFHFNKSFLMSHFGLSFMDYYFNPDKYFMKMKTEYRDKYKASLDLKLFNYPCKIRNYSNGIEPNMFFKYFKGFYTDSTFSITHPYYNMPPPKMKLFISDIKKFIFFDDLNKEYIKSINCEIIKFEYSTQGKIYIFDSFILFKRENLKELGLEEITLFSSSDYDLSAKDKIIVIFYSEIKEIISKRFALMWQASEMQLENGKSFLINFFSSKNKNTFYKEMRHHLKSNIIIENPQCYFLVNDFENNKWNKGKMSTYKFLLLLNKYSARSLNDSNQYFIFPWCKNTYEDFTFEEEKYFEKEKEKDREKDKDLRDFNYPIVCQTKDSRDNTKYMFDMNKPEEEKNEPGYELFQNHFNTHYSTGLYIYYYLIKNSPLTESFLKFNNGKFDSPERLFQSLTSTIKSINNVGDNRELIPELFSNFESFINFNCHCFGRSAINNELIDDLIPDNFDKNKTEEKLKLKHYFQFIAAHRLLLNSSMVKENIKQWFTYVFGPTQLEIDADNCHIFQKDSYEKYNNLWLNYQKELLIGKHTNESATQLRQKLHSILNFGQTPAELSIGQTVLKPERLKQVKNFPMFEFENTKTKIVFFKLSEDKKFAYLLLYLQIQDKKSSQDKSVFTIHVIDCEDLEFKSNFLKVPLEQDVAVYYKLIGPNLFKNTITELEKQFLICSPLDSSLKIKNIQRKRSNILSNFYSDSPILCVEKINSSNLLLGLLNGKLLEVKEKDSFRELKEKKSIIAHKKGITIIRYDKRLNLVITAGLDNYIHIRKYFNFEILSIIKIDKAFKVIDLFLNKLNVLFVYTEDNKTGRRYVSEYSLNGFLINTSRRSDDFPLSEESKSRRGSNSSSGSSDKNKGAEVVEVFPPKEEKKEDGPKMDFFFDLFVNGMIDYKTFEAEDFFKYVKKNKKEKEKEEVFAFIKVRSFYLVFIRSATKKIKLMVYNRMGK
ncbi:MAG: hypothetical protein MJ252_02570 [archaeon]|nr:hypothetical protein [archaeon]